MAPNVFLSSALRSSAVSPPPFCANQETILCESFEHEPRTQEVPEDSGLDIPEVPQPQANAVLLKAWPSFDKIRPMFSQK